MNENSGKKNPQVDEAGIRLAPTPMDGGAAKKMPTVVQEFVITPRLEYQTSDAAQAQAVSTSSDYQPAEKTRAGDGSGRCARAISCPRS